MLIGSTTILTVGQLQDLESKNPALSGALSSRGTSKRPDASEVKPNDAADGFLPSSSEGGSPQNERANASIGSAHSGLLEPSASQLTRDIARSVNAGIVKGYGDLVNWIGMHSINHKSDWRD